MKQFSIFHPFVLSLFSKDLYREVGRNWKGLAAGYLFLLMVVACIPSAVNVHFGLKDALGKDIPELVQQLPVMTIKNGELETDPPGKHVITEPKSGRAVMIIDATEESADPQAPLDTILITKKELIINQRGGMERRVPLSKIGDRTITQANAMAFLEGVIRWLPPLWFVIILIASFVFRLVQALLYGAIGNAFTQSLKVNLDYAALTRLAVLAITPVVYLNLVFEFFVQGLPWFVRWPVCIVVAIGYLRFGVKACVEQPATAAAGTIAPPA